MRSSIFEYLLQKVKQGTQLTSKMQKQLEKVLPDNVKKMVTYQSKKLTSKFPVKDKIDFQHQNNVVYSQL